jgi:hypothetical protein
MRREGSTLSEILRSAWDGSPLENRVKGHQIIARNTHVSVLAHVTESELKAQMSATESFNGFANRFLWFSTRRSKSLPFGGGDVALAPLVKEFHDVREYAATIGRVEMDEDAAAIWGQGGVYDLLTERPEGQFGAVTGRAEAHVTRLCLFYAVMDAEKVIRVPHLLAALAVWEYSERSCRYLFGTSSGDDYTDTIEELLQEAYPSALTRTELRDRFGRHAEPGRIPKALIALERAGRAEKSFSKTPGRPVEYWRFLGRDLGDRSDKSDKSPLERARQLAGSMTREG